jgi:6-pyruvoyl-tetrahydropterin synthase related domain
VDRPQVRQGWIDVLGLAALLLALLDYVRPALLLLPTIAAGGDTPCHYPTAAFVRDVLLPQGRMHGWYAGAYLGQPLPLYYFPLPFWIMALLTPLAGPEAAFKLGAALPVLLLPLCAYVSLRCMGARFPTPLLGAGGCWIFLFVEDNPIWGGTAASTLAGEFAYTWGLGLALLFLGVLVRARERDASPALPGALLALTALAHGYAVLWAGFSATFLLYGARVTARRILWLATVAVLAFALAAFWLLPLLSAWGWTTAYDDPWITIGWRNLFPPLLLPLFAAAVVGLGYTLVDARLGGALQRPLLYLWHSALLALALALAAPRLGIVHARFLPFAQLALSLAGAVTLGVLLERLRWRGLAALGCLLLAIVYADSRSQVLRAWIDWDYTGLEAKPLWPTFQRLADTLRGGVGDPRVAVEYSAEHEHAGSIRMYETLPFFSGRSTLEGVYNQASLQTHAVYYLASELSAVSPNPFRKREYSAMDTDNALRHLRLFNVREIVALSSQLVGALAARDDVVRVAHLPPYEVFRLLDSGPGYVEPLRFEPVRSSLVGWREKAYRWFTRKPLSDVHLVFSEDPRFGPVEADEWLAPAARPLSGDVQVESVLEAEELRITTSRPGHPLLVKVSYHPRWRAEGADGPYLVSPALMLVVPRQRDVRLYYARNWSDRAGFAVTLAALVVLVWLWRRPTSTQPPLPALRAQAWAAAIPLGLLAGLAGLALLPQADLRRREYDQVSERALHACREKLFANAAEYARQAASRAPDAEQGARWRCFRGENLLSSGDARGALRAFTEVVGAPSSQSVPRALAGAARASEGIEDMDAAKIYRQRLSREFPPSTGEGEVACTP